MTGASHPWGIDRSSLLITISWSVEGRLVVGVIGFGLVGRGYYVHDVKAGADVTLGTWRFMTQFTLLEDVATRRHSVVRE